MNKRRGRTNANRCKAGNCSKIISVKFEYCFEHKNHGRGKDFTAMKGMSRFYCESCGTVSHGHAVGSCHLCGKQTTLIEGE